MRSKRDERAALGSVRLTRRRANGLALSCAARSDRENRRVKPAFKIDLILGPQSGISCMGMLGGRFKDTKNFLVMISIYL